MMLCKWWQKISLNIGGWILLSLVHTIDFCHVHHRVTKERSIFFSFFFSFLSFPPGQTLSKWTQVLGWVYVLPFEFCVSMRMSECELIDDGQSMLSIETKVLRCIVWCDIKRMSTLHSLHRPLSVISLRSYHTIWQATIIKARKILILYTCFSETITSESIGIVVTSRRFEGEVYNSRALQGPASGNTFQLPLSIRRGYAVWLIAVHLPHNNLNCAIHPLIWQYRQTDQRTSTHSISLLS